MYMCINISIAKISLNQLLLPNCKERFFQKNCKDKLFY